VLAVVAGCAHLRDEALPSPDGRDVELTATPFFPQDAFQCGPAALATVLNTAGVAVTPELLAPRIYLPGRHGSLQLELVAAARSYHTVAYVIDAQLEAVLAEVAAGHPVLVLQDLGVGPFHVWHYAVVIGYGHSPAQIVLRSGIDARQVMKLSTFMRSWRKAQQWAVVTLAADELPATAQPLRYVESIVALETLGDVATARQAYATALERWPDSLLALFGAANTNHQLGDLPAAQAAYLRLLDLAGDNPIVLNNLAEVMLDRGCATAALHYVDVALAVSDGDQPIEAAITDTRTKALEQRARRGDGPHCTP
jgi:tetratricopeptide (TPR) repeat protein